MRAEAQDHIDKIGAALALLRRFLDWDRAVRRLDELNAKVTSREVRSSNRPVKRSAPSSAVHISGRSASPR